MHSFGGFTRFVSRPYRDAGLLVVLSRHSEDSVLLYRVMQGRIPIGTNRHFSFVIDSTGCRHDFDIVEGARCDIEGYDDEAGIGVFFAKCL